MEAIPAPRAMSTSGNGTAERVRHASAVLALTLFVASMQGAAQERIAVVWKLRELSFFYRSSVAIYSCSALKGRVASILRAVGARDDLEVKVDDCGEFISPPDAAANDPGSSWETPSDRSPDRVTGHQQTAHVQVSVMMPTAVTPEVLAEIERDRSRRELVLRATGNPASKLTDPNVFTAQWRQVTLSRKTIGLDAAECELLDQMSRGVFRELGVRVVRRGFACDPRRVSRISPELEVEALLPTLFVTSEAQQTPAEREDDTDAGGPDASDEEPAEPDAGNAPE